MEVVCGAFNASGRRDDVAVDAWTPCHVDVLNVYIGVALTASTLAAAIFVQCQSARRREDVLQPRLQGHTLRSLLFIFILLASLVDIADALLSKLQPILLASSVTTLVTWFGVAVFHYHVESRHRPGLLLVSGVGCLAFGASRAVRCQAWYLADLDLDWSFVRPVAAAGVAALFGVLALLDLGVLAKELHRPKSYVISQQLSCEEKVIYRHLDANFFSRATFFWLTSLFRVGHANPLELEDLGVLPPPEATDRVYAKFKKIYDDEKRCAMAKRRGVSLWRCYVKSCWPMFALGGLFKMCGDFVGFVGPIGISVIIQYVAKLSSDGSDQNAANDVSIKEFFENGYVMSVIILVSALAHGTFSQNSTHLVNVEGIHLKSALQALVYNKALRLCVWNIADQKDEAGTEAEENGKGVGIPNDGGEKIKLEKTSSDRSSASVMDVGMITNHMSEDAMNVMSCIWIGHYIWAIPLKIGVLIYLLYVKLGISAIVGSAICILTMTPLQFLIGKKMSTNSKAITEKSDERLRKVNEVLQGIKLLKLYGWECVYGKRIAETRKNELVFLDKDSLYWALMTFLTQASSVMVTLVTFGVYFALDQTSMTADKVFAGLALFNQLTVPLFIFPITVPIIISALLSTKRLEDFLALPETTTPALGDADDADADADADADGVRESVVVQTTGSQVEAVLVNHQRPSAFGLVNILENEEGTRDDDEEEDDDVEEGKETEDVKEAEEKVVEVGDVVLSVKNGCFSWSGDNKSSLSMINVDFEAAKLTVVVGKVGSGKTSLLSALLGEMHTVGGKIDWKKGSTIAYAAQKPWLLNASLRANILFGERFRPRRYARVIEACALQPDIDILPGKDDTEIGEKGITLSGGQKQRVSIARALYTQASVVVMDDPLSALDHQVGQQVFDNGIKRLLLRQRRTVILVTHRLQLLSQAHKIVALEDGRVRAQGSLREIERSDAALAQEWVAIMSREAQEEQSRWRTARERWQLVKLVSRVGVQLKQRHGPAASWQNEEPAVTPPTFVRLRRRIGNFSGSSYFSHDLPLPTDECDDEFVSRPVRPSIKRQRLASAAHSNYSIGVSALPQHRAVVRTSSLQMHDGLPYRVVRQSSSPNMQNDGLPHAPCRTRNFTMEGEPRTNMFKRILSLKERRSTSSYNAAADPSSGVVKDHGVLTRLMSSPGSKPAVTATQEHSKLKRMLSTTSTFSEDFNDDDEYEGGVDSVAGRLTSDEEREYGKIPRRIYAVYLCACGVTVGLGYVVSTVVWQGLRVYTDFWLSKWSSSYNDPVALGNSTCGVALGTHPSLSKKRDVGENDEMLLYLEVYAGLSIVSILLSLSSNAIGQYAGARARRTLHDKMLRNLLRCPIRFFETTPVGRIINRFSTDMSVIDKKIATTIQRLLQFLLMVFSAILVNAYVSYWFLLLAVPICVAYFLVQRFYRNSARELQRLDSITRSPVFSHFSETLGGLSTIRAFSHQRLFTEMLHCRLDVHANVFLVMNTGNRWLGIALDYLGGVIVFVAIIVSLVTATVAPCLITPAQVGLAINYTLLVPIYLHWVVKFLSDMEVYMSAVERVEQYAHTPTEDYREQGLSVPSNWPEKGDIVFEGVSLRYDVGREPIVSNFTLHIPAGQKVGICGRSGSGKSSLVLSLFNMIDVFEGSILIDGVDIKKVPLQVLRSRLSIIPQDVLMFSGTIRSNLDPKAQYSDEKLWNSLELAQLKDIVRKYPGGLDGEVREGGENLSAGQKQLFCLARAILHEAACLVMDEATSSVDPATEKALLAAATKAFAARTVITIAHRLPTILDCDRIIVLDAGRIVEDGKPSQLLNRSMGIFSTMLRASEEGSLAPLHPQ